MYGIVAEHGSVDNIVAVLGIATDGDAEDIFHRGAMPVEGGAAKRIALAHIGEQPAVVDFAQRDVSRTTDGIQQPDIFLEECRCFAHCVNLLCLLYVNHTSHLIGKMPHGSPEAFSGCFLDSHCIELTFF